MLPQFISKVVTLPFAILSALFISMTPSLAQGVRINNDGTVILLDTASVFRLGEKLRIAQIGRSLRDTMYSVEVQYSQRNVAVISKHGTEILWLFLDDRDRLYQVETGEGAEWVTEDDYSKRTTLDEITKRRALDCNYDGKEPSCSFSQGPNMISLLTSDYCPKFVDYATKITERKVEGTPNKQISNSNFGCGTLGSVRVQRSN